MRLFLKKIVIASVLVLVAGQTAFADFKRWSFTSEEDPFSGGKTVMAINMSSLRTGVAIICKSEDKEIAVRSIPGFTYDSSMAYYTPTLKIAIDSKIIIDGVEGRTGSVGDNLAISEAKLEGEDAEKFLEAMKTAKKQIAIQDGISSAPQLMTAAGSTKTAEALLKCFKGE